MRKSFIGLIAGFGLLGLLAIYVVAHGQAEHKVRLLRTRTVLLQAYDEYLRTGSLPAQNGTWAIWLCTNEVVVEGRTIPLRAATANAGDTSEGAFALALTQEIVLVEPVRISNAAVCL